MIEAEEKSNAVTAEVHPDVLLDSRLALYHRRQDWLALADVHYGYEIARRAGGGLYPLWGMDSIDRRLASLIADYSPETLIIAGDIVDGAAAGPESIAWLQSLQERCPRVVLVAGNHDRGPVRRRIEMVDRFHTPGFLFHHGHLPLPDPAPGPSFGAASATEPVIEICGHWHPAISFHDGAGLSLRAPALIQESSPATGAHRWILPAFSPWAAGGPRKTPKNASVRVRTWLCTRSRVFQME